MPWIFIIILASLVFAPLAQAREGKIFLRQEEGKATGITPVFVDSETGAREELRGEVSSEITSGDTVYLSKNSRSTQNLRLLKKGRNLNHIKGKRGFLLAFLSWNEAPGASPKESYQELKSWSSEASDGRWVWDPVTIVEITLPKQPLCNEDSWSRDTRKKLTEMGYNLYRDYGALGIVLPPAVTCVETAYAYLGPCQLNPRDLFCGLSVYDHNYSSLKTVVHELGHTLGLGHANTAPCQEAGSPVTLTYKGLCEYKEYGDRYDPMGSSFSVSSFNPFYNQQLGWLDDKLIKVPPRGEVLTFELNPYAENRGTRSLMVPLPPNQFTGSKTSGKLALEYKERIGIDEALWNSGSSACSRLTPRGHLFLRYLPDEETADKMEIISEESYLLDMTPETEDLCDSGMPPGQTWQDPTGGLRVTYLGVENGKARVSLTTHQSSPAKISFRPLKKKKTRSTNLRFTVQASDIINGLNRSNVFIKKGRCKIRPLSFTDWSSSNYLISMKCKPGLVQMGIRARSFEDQLFFTVPETLILSQKIRVLPPKKRK